MTHAESVESTRFNASLWVVAIETTDCGRMIYTKGVSEETFRRLLRHLSQAPTNSNLALPHGCSRWLDAVLSTVCARIPCGPRTRRRSNLTAWVDESFGQACLRRAKQWKRRAPQKCSVAGALLQLRWGAAVAAWHADNPRAKGQAHFGWMWSLINRLTPAVVGYCTHVSQCFGHVGPNSSNFRIVAPSRGAARPVL